MSLLLRREVLLLREQREEQATLKAYSQPLFSRQQQDRAQAKSDLLIGELEAAEGQMFSLAVCCQEGEEFRDPWMEPDKPKKGKGKGKRQEPEAPLDQVVSCFDGRGLHLPGTPQTLWRLLLRLLPKCRRSLALQLHLWLTLPLQADKLN